MVDKKLSSFSEITAAEISKLVVLYLDQNNAIKNGKVDWATLDALLAHKAGSETITGNKTFSGNNVFSGQVTFNNPITADIYGTANSARNDGNGNTISLTYAKLGANNPFSGDNVFSGSNQFNNPIWCNDSYLVKNAYENTTSTPASQVNTYPLIIKDVNNNDMSFINQYHFTNGEVWIKMCASVGAGNTRKFADFAIGTTPAGVQYADASGGVKSSINRWGMPNWGGQVWINYPTSASVYTAPTNGYYMCSFASNSQTTSNTLYVNNVQRLTRWYHKSYLENATAITTIPLNAGDQIYWSMGSIWTGGSTNCFIPCNGG